MIHKKYLNFKYKSEFCTILISKIHTHPNLNQGAITFTYKKYVYYKNQAILRIKLNLNRNNLLSSIKKSKVVIFLQVVINIH